MADDIAAGAAGLTHLRADGTAAMVDVSAKAVTKRVATACGVFRTTTEVIEAVRGGGITKGDVLATARIAGIQGAKRTSDLIPLCHQLSLSKVAVDFTLSDTQITITATAATTGRTGVEMEALTAVAVAGLTLHDMVKALDPASELTGITLQSKSGGRRGHWRRESAAAPGQVPLHDTQRAVVLVSSTRCAAGQREDTTGPVIVEWLAAQGLSPDPAIVIADTEFAGELRRVLATHPAVVVTTGGTGPTVDDLVPEATAALLTTALPGIAEAIRDKGRATTPLAALSRGLAGLAGGTFVVNLPGSSGGVRDGLDVLAPILGHLLELAQGAGHDD
ncbi:MAG: bifunctional molybdenum cofactor biosynthesis protein MoaC/MoaB [Gordonia sp. (in: high G+C Gram-positive bacteria)]|uniref:bifunctional molybdenum cofactor biosynthesis protein MoaC/MoaB n=1 Tax=Gordonia sp. (in: high G+C Gram-positive bacteria) TaxID=84139 RepID=UPI003BB57440